MMISTSDILQVIGEIHQYSMLLFELKNSTTFGILNVPREKVNYFKIEGILGRRERLELVKQVYSGEMPRSVHPLSVEHFMQEIESKKTRHIWLEAVSPERRELAFLTISELKTFLRSSRER
jgi:hypothetical protein